MDTVVIIKGLHCFENECTQFGRYVRRKRQHQQHKQHPEMRNVSWTLLYLVVVKFALKNNFIEQNYILMSDVMPTLNKNK